MDSKSTALAERQPQNLAQNLAGHVITTPLEFAERIRELQGQVHLIAPMAAVTAIAPGYVVNSIVVVIDPSVDPKTGAGADVYHQQAIHKTSKQGNEWVPMEVSLNKNGLLKFLAARGVNVWPTQRLDDGRRANYWMLQANGDVIEFDGQVRRLPAGTVEIDLRDGSPQIGEWTPEKWAESVREADARKAALRPDEQWKAKPEPVGGWTAERVLRARQFGLRLAEAKALNALARNLGIKQKYTVAELAKPFLVFKPSVQLDITNPRVQEMLALSALGARATLYPRTSQADTPPAQAHGDPNAVVADLPMEPDVPSDPPDDAVEADFEDVATTPSYLVEKVTKREANGQLQYFAKTQQGPTLYTTDLAVAKALHAACKAQQPVLAETERVSVLGATYQQVLELGAPGLKL